MSEETAATTVVTAEATKETIVTVQMRREDSLDVEEDAEAVDNNTEFDLTNLPPGRLHAVKGHHRLQGSAGNLIETLQRGENPAGMHTPRSRSRSPSIGRDGKINTGTNTVSTAAIDANSSISSFDELFDPDILTDRAGTLDDLSESQRKLHNSSKELHLPSTVMERMSEESLEDSHAFSDCPVQVQRASSSSNASRVSHVSGSVAGDGMLEPLDECDEGLEDDCDSSLEDIPGDDEYHLQENDDFPHAENTGGAAQQTTTVILTNMENLTLQQTGDQDNLYSNDIARTGESSLLGEAPSAPTV